MVNYPKPVSKRKFAKSRKAKPTTITKRVRTSTYSPYNNARTGTNPANYARFLGRGFPDQLNMNFTYSDSFVLDPSATAICPFKTYRMSSPFDPDYSLGGNQPVYWDTLTSVYHRYAVQGAKITAIFSQGTRTGQNIGPYIVGINNSEVPDIPTTNGSLLMTQPNTSFEVFTLERGISKVTSTYSRQKVYPDLPNGSQARTNANPTDPWYAHVFATPQGVDVESPINVMIVIEYNVTFSDLKQLTDA